MAPTYAVATLDAGLAPTSSDALAGLPSRARMSADGRLVATTTFAEASAPWRRAGTAEHGFTHFTLRADVYAARIPLLPPGGERRPATTAAAEMPTVFARMARLAQAALSGRGVPDGA